MRIELPFPVKYTDISDILLLTEKLIPKDVSISSYNPTHKSDTYNTSEKKDISFSFVALDSRECELNDLFFCLSGKEEHIRAAMEKGAVYAGGRKELLSLANYIRNAVNPTTIAITGSVGKTTVKEYIYSVLSEKYRVHKSEGNHNNDIGLPVSILSMKKDTEYLVLELGTNHPGEIRTLSECCEPNIVFITNIGTSHIGNFGSIENIAKEKLSAVSCAKKNYTLIMNGDDTHLTSVKNLTNGKYISVYNSSSEYKINIIEEDADSTVFEINGNRLKTKHPGLHMVYAAAMAYAAGTLCGMSYDEIVLGMSKFRMPPMRQNIYTLRDYTIIDDCYNASYESTVCALKILSDRKIRSGIRTVAVIGDILELGEKGEEIHHMVGESAGKTGLDLLIVFGSFCSAVADGARASGMKAEAIIQIPTDNHGEIASAVLSHIRVGDTLLFKASRKMKCEKIIEIIKESLEP